MPALKLPPGKPISDSRGWDVVESIDVIRYYAGWAGKNQGKVIETTEAVLAYTRHEPIGVCGQIIPWNFPRRFSYLRGIIFPFDAVHLLVLMCSWKLGPALSTGNTVVMKPSELTPLTALRITQLAAEAGFPPGVINMVTGYGKTVGHAITTHPKIEKVAFTGSTLVGREVMIQAAKSNLKNVTLELGGKSPNIIFDDADLDAAVDWAAFGIL